MPKEEIKIQFNRYKHSSELTPEDQDILESAVNVAEDAYAPYSNFKVGAAVKLANGKTICGSNQENAAYPSGLCAERVTLFSAGANFKGIIMNTLAIYAASVSTANKQISPCGACRQVMVEYEVKQNKNIRVLLMNSSREVWEFTSCKDFLPLAFDSTALKN